VTIEDILARRAGTIGRQVVDAVVQTGGVTRASAVRFDPSEADFRSMLAELRAKWREYVHAQAEGRRFKPPTHWTQESWARRRGGTGRRVYR